MSAVAGAILMMLAAEIGGSNPPLVAGVVMIMVAIVLGMITMQRRRSTRTPDISTYVRQQASRVRQQDGVREDMERIFVQISDLSRQLNAQMDTRFAKLEQAIAEADEKIATLESLLRKAAGIQGVDVTVDDSPTGRLPAQASNGQDANKVRSRKTGKGSPGAEQVEARPDTPAARTTGGAGTVDTSGGAESAAGLKTPALPPDPGELRYGRIYQLADQGLPIVEIARQVGQTTGEVELILNLRKSRGR
jgi:hypothetical protein